MKSSAGNWGDILPRSFYARPARQVARELLGAYLIHRIGNRVLAGKIVETEAYLGTADRAAHAWHGLTERTKVIFGPPGHAYVYLIYGMYECLNLVADRDGAAGCVLIRALEPVLGIEEMRRRRAGPRGGVPRLEQLASGPGKLTLAMGITRRQNGQDVTRGPLVVRRAKSAEPVPVEVGPRVGIRHAVERPLRFYIRDNSFVSQAGRPHGEL